MKLTNKEMIWLEDLTKKSDEILQQEIDSLNNASHNCELQEFCTKLFLKSKEIEQKYDKLQGEYNSLQIECNILRTTLRKNSGIEE